jgi:hypothetical protein
LSIFLFVVKPYPISRLPFFPISAVEAIPSNAGVCFEMSSLQAFREEIEKNSSLEKLENIFVFQQYKRDFDLLEIILKKDSLRHQRLLQTPLIAVMQNGGLDAVNFLFILETGSSKDAADFQTWLESLPDLAVSSTIFKSELVHKVKQKNGGSFSFVVFRNLILVGRYPLLIEDAINQLKVVREPFFKGFMAPKVLPLPEPLRVYIRPKNLPLLVLPFINRKGKQHMDVLYDIEELIAVDVLFDEGGISLQESIDLKGKEPWFKSVKKQRARDRSGFAEVLPRHTALVQWLSLSDLTAFAGNTSSSTYKKYFEPWIGNQAALVTTEPYSINLDAENFLLIAAKDAELGEHYLQKLGEVEGELGAYEYMTYTIRQIMSNDFFEKSLWPGFKLKNPFVTFINGYMVAAQSQQALEVWIDKYNAGQTLNNTTAFQESSGRLNASAKWWAHFHTDNARQLLVTYLRKEYEPQFNQQFEILKNITPADFIINEKDKLSGFLSRQGKTGKGASILWKTRLSKDIIGTPKVIEYANSKQFEVLVQDQSNLLYLLSSGGEVIWKKKLDGPILSEIQTIDYYKNNQNHFLFNTAGSVYLYNNEGVSVSNFPLKLRSKATNGVIAVDFDGLRNYAFFVACRNGKLYGFQKTGRPLDGWPQSNMRRVEHPVRHFQQEGKDFIVALNTKGKMMVFDKKGKNRFSDIRLGDTFLSPPDFDDIATATRIVAVSEDGVAQIVNTFGDKFKLNLEVGKNEKVKFAYADLVADKRKDFIVSSESQLATYAYQEGGDFSKNFVIDTKNQVDELFVVSVPGRDKAVIGTVSKEKEQISLYSAEGKKFKDFPLAGSTAFRIVKLYKSGENILIVGKGDSVFVYRLR